MNRYAAALVALLLAACAQTPTPVVPSVPVPGPVTPTESKSESTWGMAKHATGVYTVGYVGNKMNGTPVGKGAGFIRKYDTQGDLLWEKVFGQENDECALAVASDDEGNAYVAGVDNGSVQPGSHNDVHLRKFDPSGNLVWEREFGSAAYDNVSSLAVSGSALYVVGSTKGILAQEPDGQDVYIRKYTTSGEVLWTRQFGSSGNDIGYDVAVDGNGHAYVTGMAHGSLVDDTQEGTFLRRYDRDGSVAWTQQVPYGDAQTFSKVAVSGDNVYLAFAYIAELVVNESTQDMRVLKFNRAGTQDANWAFDYNPEGSGVLWDLSTDGDGGVYFAGGSNLDADAADGIVVKLTSAGELAWQQTLAAPESGITMAVLARSPQEVYVTGGILDLDRRFTEAYLKRLDGSNGNTVWSVD